MREEPLKATYLILAEPKRLVDEKASDFSEKAPFTSSMPAPVSFDSGLRNVM
jgi:hypothetical protein